MPKEEASNYDENDRLAQKGYIVRSEEDASFGLRPTMGGVCQRINHRIIDLRFLSTMIQGKRIHAIDIILYPC